MSLPRPAPALRAADVAECVSRGGETAQTTLPLRGEVCVPLETRQPSDCSDRNSTLGDFCGWVLKGTRAPAPGDTQGGALSHEEPSLAAGCGCPGRQPRRRQPVTAAPTAGCGGGARVTAAWRRHPGDPRTWRGHPGDRGMEGAVEGAPRRSRRPTHLPGGSGRHGAERRHREAQRVTTGVCAAASGCHASQCWRRNRCEISQLTAG